MPVQRFTIEDPYVDEEPDAGVDEEPDEDPYSDEDPDAYDDPDADEDPYEDEDKDEDKDEAPYTDEEPDEDEDPKEGVKSTTFLVSIVGTVFIVTRVGVKVDVAVVGVVLDVIGEDAWQSWEKLKMSDCNEFHEQKCPQYCAKKQTTFSKTTTKW